MDVFCEIKRWIDKIKGDVTICFPESRAFEFVAKLEEHPIGDQNIYIDYIMLIIIELGKAMGDKIIILVW